MTDNNDSINQLHARLDSLSGKQAEISREINNLRMEISRLKVSQPQEEEEKKAASVATTTHLLEDTKADIFQPVSPQEPVSRPFSSAPSRAAEGPKVRSDLEKFIGENLINKIGIAITVIGVAIGTKYSIEHELISPLTRIILGYLFGIGLLGFGMRLKAKYENFSAVLVSGAMAILYFITYAAYNFYHLIPQIPTFGLLVVFTLFTVVAAIQYNLQVIAHIGLVGAYAVPFLLSEGSGNVNILFSYMAIINIGILVISFKKYWKALYYSSFVLTWIIFFSWYSKDYRMEDHFTLAMVFLALFFAIFYTCFLSYKLLKKEKFDKDDIVLLLANSFIFFGLGYATLNGQKTGAQLLGLFTLGNAIIHFIVVTLIYRLKLADRNLFYLVAGLVLLFITIAVPVQLDGNWVTLIWVGEAALLFWIGRTRNMAFYEKLAYPLMLLAFMSLLLDWLNYGAYLPENPETRITPLFNIQFLSSLLFIGAFTFINWLGQNKKYPSAMESSKGLFKTVASLIPAILLITLYYAFRVEISNYWNQLYKDSGLQMNVSGQEHTGYYWNMDLIKYKTLWIINYSLLFFSLLSLINLRKIKNKKLGAISLGLSVMTILVFLTQGLYSLSELRESYLLQTLGQYYKISSFNLGMRYVSYAFVGFTLFVCCQTLRPLTKRQDLNKSLEGFLYLTILWVSSSEWINLMDLAHSTQSYKIGLSILWGIYSLMLIALGIWKKKKHIRIGAIALFAVTLLKLFVYDISHLDTIAKTIVFVSLGILLLIISFLYNKYKQFISDEIKI